MKLARIFQDYMVLQQQKTTPVWGESEAEQKISVKLNGTELLTEEIGAGEFSLLLPPLEAAEDVSLAIGDIMLSHVDIGEVWIAGGQSNMEYALEYDHDAEATMAEAHDEHMRTYIVGQYSFEGEREAGYKSWNPWEKWLIFETENAPRLPAVAVYFAKELRGRGVPVGIISCNWGGTSVSSWMDRKIMEEDPDLRVYVDEFDAAVSKLDLQQYYAVKSVVRPLLACREMTDIMGIMMKNTFKPEQMMQMIASSQPESLPGAVPAGIPNEMTAGSADFIKTDQGRTMMDMASLPMEVLMAAGPGDATEPGVLYEYMVKAIAGYAARGVIWYQGENDETHASLYEKAFSAMIDCWRQTWKEKNPGMERLPFLEVQLAPFGTWLNGSGANYPEVRRQQEMTTRMKEDVWMASISDLGNIYDIHPKVKKPVGVRLAKLAEEHIYGEETEADAPEAVGAMRNGDELRISFLHGEGLHVVPEDFSSYNGFAAAEIPEELLPPILGGICGLVVRVDEEKVEEARCRTEGSDLIVRAAKIRTAEEVRVEYASTAFYQVNLYNEADLPAKPFSLNAR